MTYFCKICGSPLPTDFTQECPCLSQPKPTTLYWQDTRRSAIFTLSADNLELTFEKWIKNESTDDTIYVNINEKPDVSFSFREKEALSAPKGYLFDLITLLTLNLCLSTKKDKSV